MGPGNAGGGGRGGGNDYSDAKDLLDRIGEEVYKEVKSESNGFKDDLKGNLNTANNSSVELAGFSEPCDIINNNRDKLAARDDPCKELSEKYVERFSDKIGGQCTDSKIKGNKNNCGACAPYRRLHLCHHNLETINNTTSMTTHDLLLEVCYAAKYEGNSIETHYTKHEQTNPDSQLCTVLARSFADIGDIVRGRDLFHGNPQEKEKRDELDDKLKKIFKKIHDDVISNSSNKDTLQERYKDDENYYQLREDWWTANRHTVWEALTCDARDKAEYFRPTCNSADGNSQSQATKQCRCQKKNGEHDTDQVPTYFDYVPQFLRWFEEWAEDFCRLRKHKLKDVKKYCRGDHDGDKYCSGNGFDCKETVRGNEHFVEKDCHDCSYSCSPFVKWLDNQKLEFLKQKKKYTKEITRGGGSKKRGARASDDNGYESKFYKKMKKKKKYVKVGEFLDLLSKETTCKDQPQVGNEKASPVDFTKQANTTFSRTEICEPCPWCGTEEEDGKWKAKQGNCGKEKKYDKYYITEIPVLTPEKGKFGIYQKYKTFCNSETGAANGGKGGSDGGGGVGKSVAAKGGGGKGGKSATGGVSQIKTWECYYDKNKESGQSNDNCVQGTWDTFTQGKQTVKSYNAFFWDWVYHMLHDSLDWRNELDNCLKNENKQCIIKCNRECDCFLKWVKQKKEQEWTKIKDHFKKQKNIDTAGPLGEAFRSPDVVLEYVLKGGNLLQNIKDTHANADDIKRIEELLQQAGAVGGVAGGFGTGANGKHNTKIDEFLQEEAKDATKCKNCQPTKVKNPCSGESGKKLYPVVAHKVAKEMQQQTREEMLRRSADKSVKGDKSSLEGDISLAEFKNGGQGSDLIGDNICNISIKHSNDSRNDNNGGPCYGKDNGGERFKIGTPWKGPGELNTTYKDFYLPPRREHMCTSNLENLSTSSKGLSDSKHASHSLLVDVMLAANKQAERIKNDFFSKKYDNAAACRALRYSFADLGDIIRGKDIFIGNKKKDKLEENLKTIFGKIYEKLNGAKEYYQDKNGGNFLKLREDWWTANRETVWKAMKCHTSGITCESDTTPYDDYIPQRLRWMTEWAEWFCKEQYSLYDKLFMQCAKCKDKKGGKGCKKNTTECNDCKQACDTYKEKINTWKQQWNNMQIPYALSYREAENGSAGKVFVGTDPDYNQVVDFFEQLQEKYKTAPRSSSTTNSPYATPAGYIHQEARTGECLGQNEFCEKKHGVTSSNGEDNTEYTFKQPPPQYKDACECKPPQQEDKGLGRSNTSPNVQPDGPSRDTARGPDTGSGDEEDEDEDEDEDEEEVEEETTETATGDTGPQEELPVRTTDTSVEVCATVDKLFSDKTNLQDACRQKYGPGGKEKFPNWKCVTPSGDSTTTREGSGESAGHSRAKRDTEGAHGKSDGSICVPPRRRKLYVGKLHDWANSGNTQADGKAAQAGESSQQEQEQQQEQQQQQQQQKQLLQPQSPVAVSQSSSTDNGVSTSTTESSLLHAFVKSAAVETFFAWHEYKKQKEKPQGVGVAPQLQLFTDTLGDSGESEEKTPQQWLQQGHIPPSFLRQMFYTLGDYRDILVRGVADDKNGGNNIVLEASGTQEEKQKMQEIQEKLKTFFSNSGNQATSGTSRVPSRGNPSNSGTTPQQTWWNENAQHIWKGMVCALTYEDNGPKGQSSNIQQNSGLKTAFFGDKDNPGTQNGKPVPTGLPSTQKGTFESKYQYTNVKLEDENGAKSTQTTSSSSGDNTPKLKDFVKLPPFFRWLHEWGSDFCDKRARMLEKIKEECTEDGEGGKQKYSGDGEDCNEILREKYDTVPSLGWSCPKSCGLYKRWIERKGTEYDKQEKIYVQQKTDAKNNNGFCGKLEDNAAKFLQKLASCSKTYIDNGKSKTIFDVNGETFRPAENCTPCPKFKVNCQKGNCDTTKGDECKSKDSIGPTDIGNGRNSAEELDMLVSDNSGKELYGLEACQDKCIFEGIRKDEWKCGNVCGYNVCKPKNVNGKIVDGKENGENQIIIIRALFKIWLEYFLEDYNKIRKKLKPCMNKVEQSPCIIDYEKKYQCVLQWIHHKRTEWGKIKKHYLDKNTHGDKDLKTLVSNFFGDVQPQTDVNKAIKPCPNLKAFEKSCGLNHTDNSKEVKKGAQEDNDLVLCMLKKLEKKISECKTQHTGDTQRTCDVSTSLVEDDDEPLEEEEENQVVQPKICPTQKPAQQEEEEGKCGEPEPAPPAPSDDQGDQVPKSQKDEVPQEPPPPDKKASAPNKEETSPSSPPPSDQPTNSISDILSSTIPFGIAIALTSIVFLFLKCLCICILC
ncbi:hypothetical protein C923_04316 [Plasmodium falciparum UGT5.1]|uniref:Duffy-binding-like domain-containing protein n=1 Tax=Plasmodium falciparum UGT5.1 TaxID=1237627 RepID=W7JTZ3_PLAFA|nr:hypothetical protein C923_04316 [Plasmodium falciparum UGT5.1]